MASKLLLLLSVVVFLGGCAALKTPLMKNDLQLVKAEQDAQLVKMQGEISAIKEANLKATSMIGAGNQTDETNTNTHSGRDSISTVSNDSKLMAEVLDTYKKLSERYIKLLKYIIYVLFGLLGGMFTTMIGLIGWVIKYQMRENTRGDKVVEELLEKKS